ncbi:MAG: flagellar filament capping protein FliD [Terracidiphilus sp.]|jgi:flagellar hook-associated protein 2
MGGVVGLNFGSPTSGAGFNVSSTVAQIVGNLQNVETPWKTQLTALEGQDTAISSIGTLLSNLSNDMSSLTEATGVLSQKTGSSSDTNVLELTSASNSAVAGTHAVTVTNLAQTSSGYLNKVTNASDILSGSITLQVGSAGTPQIITLTSSDNTLAGLAKAINASGVGITASVLTDSTGSQLSLVSGTSGAAGGIVYSANSITDVTNSNTPLAYNVGVLPKDANLTVDGVTLTSASNTVTNLIPGVTFQLLAPSATESDLSLEQVQVVIGNYNAGVESTVNTMVNDYNSLISAMNAQEGLNASGQVEPLFGSPTLSLLQQDLLGGINMQNPNGYLNAISTDNDTTLSGSMTIQVGKGTAQTIVLGAAPGSPAANTFYAGAGVNTLSGLAAAIDAANIGVTAAVVTANGQSTLTLDSGTAGFTGALIVNSSIVANSDTPQYYTDTVGYTGTTGDTGSLGALPSSTDLLKGSITIQVGAGTPQTITVDPSNNNLAGLASQINLSGLGVTATPVTNDGVSSLSLVSGTVGAAGALSVSSSLLDTTSKTNSTLAYTNSSDVAGLTGLGITVNSDGSLTLDATSLDSLLNSDYSGTQGLFQNANSWGMTFATMLNNAGTGSSTGILSLAQGSNSTVESTLNADISREGSVISAEQASLTTELNTANQIMEQLPTQLEGVNELYSAITGYDQNTNG